MGIGAVVLNDAAIDQNCMVGARAPSLRPNWHSNPLPPAHSPQVTGCTARPQRQASKARCVMHRRQRQSAVPDPEPMPVPTPTSQPHGAAPIFCWPRRCGPRKGPSWPSNSLAAHELSAAPIAGQLGRQHGVGLLHSKAKALPKRHRALNGDERRLLQARLPSADQHLIH